MVGFQLGGEIPFQLPGRPFGAAGGFGNQNRADLSVPRGGEEIQVEHPVGDGYREGEVKGRIFPRHVVNIQAPDGQFSFHPEVENSLVPGGVGGFDELESQIIAPLGKRDVMGSGITK